MPGEPPYRVTPRIHAMLPEPSSADQVGSVRWSLALSIAMKLDEAVEAESAASAIAVPQLSKELRSVLEEILGAQDEKQELLDSIFTST